MPKSQKTKRKQLQPRTRAHRIVKDTFVPHARNKYQPHATRRHGLVVLAFMVAFLQLGYNFSQTGSVLGAKTDVTSNQLLAATNQERNSNGEGRLAIDERLSKAAELKANDMFAQQYWAHTAPSGTTPWKWFEDSQYMYQNAGENLAKGFRTSSGVVTAWMNSPEHRENLLNNSYKDVGFAVKSGELNGEKTTLVVALYGNPATSKVATTPQTVLASTDESLGFVARIGVGIQSMTPALLGSITLLLLGAATALVAHSYRKKLPYALQKTWAKHHSLYKAVGMTSLVFVLLALYGGGQI